MHPVLLTIWALLGATFLGLLVYRSHLTRYENEQLFLLDEDEATRVTESQRLVSRIQSLQTAYFGLATATAIMTLTVVGIYVYNAGESIRWVIR